MKAKEFINVMRKLIREEVRHAIREELGLIKENKVKQVQEVKRQPVAQPRKPKYNTGNPFLDEVLSETVVGRGFGNEDMPLVTEELSYTSDDIPSMSSLLSEEDVPTNPVPTTMAMPFMKDYSQLMKKADQISQNKMF